MSRKTIAGALLALTLLASPAAQATYDPIGSGKAQILLDRGFASFLAKDGIKLGAKAGVRLHGRNLAFQVGGGNLDPTIGMGEIEAEGTLLFQAGNKKVPLREVRARTKHDTLIAKVGGSQLKIATSAKRDTKRSGFGTTYSAKALKLTAKLATRLNKKLRPKQPFFAGQLLGSLSANAQPELATILPEGRASIPLDPGFTAKMDSLFVSINPIFPAEHQGSTFTFPIAVGGSLAPDGSRGTLRTGGSVEFLQLGAGQVFWQELWLDLAARSDTAEVDVEPTPAFPGKLGRIGVLDLGAAAVSSDPKARTISVSAAPLTLQASAAANFNQAFAPGKEPFKAGEAVGALSFSAQGQ